jgi:hypothetical protein
MPAAVAVEAAAYPNEEPSLAGRRVVSRHRTPTIG